MIQDKIIAIHDISGFGRCSLTVALPILSAMQFEVLPLPTAILSAQTAFDGYFMKDMTDEMVSFIEHWKKLEIKAKGIYSGFLGSIGQVELIKNSVSYLLDDNGLFVVDPVMGDGGKLYPSFDKSFVKSIKKLCVEANVIVPNLTEALFLLDENPERIFSKDLNAEQIAFSLSERFDCDVVITGISGHENNSIGAVCFSNENKAFSSCFSPKIERFYSGTGDVLASVLTGCLLKNVSLANSLKIAVDFTYNSILCSEKLNQGSLDGVAFEFVLKDLIERLEKE